MKCPMIVKEAKIRLEDVEDRLGIYLSDKQEEKARNLIQKETTKRFAVRHPWLTGIPTLGLAPAISKIEAIDKITSDLLRNNPGIRAAVKKVKEERRSRSQENFTAETERLKVTQKERQAKAYGDAFSSAAGSVSEVFKKAKFIKDMSHTRCFDRV